MVLSEPTIDINGLDYTVSFEIYPNIGRECGPRVALKLFLADADPADGERGLRVTTNVPEIDTDARQVLVENDPETVDTLLALTGYSVLAKDCEDIELVEHDSRSFYRCTLSSLFDLQEWEEMLVKFMNTMLQKTHIDMCD